MADPIQAPTSIQTSTRIYHLLLQAYPPDFRREYGLHMVQVFRDACLKSYRQNCVAGLVTLWLNICYDWWQPAASVGRRPAGGRRHGDADPRPA